MAKLLCDISSDFTCIDSVHVLKGYKQARLCWISDPLYDDTKFITQGNAYVGVFNIRKFYIVDNNVGCIRLLSIYDSIKGVTWDKQR